MAPPSFTWTQLAVTSDSASISPCPRSSHGLSRIHHTLLLYGGEHVARTPIDDESQCVWTYDSNDSDSSWKRIQCTGTTFPPSRIAHAQAVHHNQHHLYVFGGRAGSTMNEQARNDLWVLNTTTFEWKQIHAANPPEARSFHRMVCCGDSLYVFGGCGAVSGRLADLHRFDIPTQTWHTLGASPLLRGRGGPSLLPLSSSKQLAVVAGFAGEETKDGHVYDLEKQQWDATALTDQLEGLRPRSVCSGGTLPSVGVALVFGGEVDPSDRGHEGAGGFANDIVVLDAETGVYIDTIAKPPGTTEWPQERGWADAVACDNGDGTGSLFLFGGLSGNDEKPERLNDLWRLDVKK